jgi:hypothetical protein
MTVGVVHVTNLPPGSDNPTVGGAPAAAARPQQAQQNLADVRAEIEVGLYKLNAVDP